MYFNSYLIMYSQVYASCWMSASIIVDSMESKTHLYVWLFVWFVIRVSKQERGREGKSKQFSSIHASSASWKHHKLNSRITHIQNEHPPLNCIDSRGRQAEAAIGCLFKNQRNSDNYQTWRFWLIRPLQLRLPSLSLNWISSKHSRFEWVTIHGKDRFNFAFAPILWLIPFLWDGRHDVLTSTTLHDVKNETKMLSFKKMKYIFSLNLCI